GAQHAFSLSLLWQQLSRFSRELSLRKVATLSPIILDSAVSSSVPPFWRQLQHSQRFQRDWPRSKLATITWLSVISLVATPFYPSSFCSLRCFQDNPSSHKPKTPTSTSLALECY